MTRRILLYLALATLTLTASAQSNGKKKTNPEDRTVNMDDPTFVPTVKVGKYSTTETAYSI